MTQPLGKRETKQAQLRHGALASFLVHHKQGGHISKVRIDDICADVSTTKVTLFTHFPTKEDILLYGQRRFEYELAVVSAQEQGQGVKGVVRFFDMAARFLGDDPPLASSLIQVLTLRSDTSPLTQYPGEDRRAFYPGHSSYWGIPTPPAEIFLLRRVNEAMVQGEIASATEPGAVAEGLKALWLGIPLAQGSETGLKQSYGQVLKPLFEGIGANDSALSLIEQVLIPS